MKPLLYERRILLLALSAGLGSTVVALILLWTGGYSSKLQWTLTVLMVLTWLSFAFTAQSRVVFPLRTLSNLLAALREGDFSIRARGANQVRREPFLVVEQYFEKMIRRELLVAAPLRKSLCRLHEALRALRILVEVHVRPIR